MRWIVTILFAMLSFTSQCQTVRVGAKHFTEGYIVSEIIAQLLEGNGVKVERSFNLGGTMVCFEALNNGSIDVYPEYSGTIVREILKKDDDLTHEQIIESLKQFENLTIGKSLGFENKYGLVITSAKASSLNATSISDLLNHQLKAGISYEFLQRKDGWESLTKAYNLALPAVGLEHGLAYEALINNKIDITDCYTTDGEISSNKLVVLKDDKHFFPEYHAVSFYRDNLPKKVISIISQLEGQISESEMSAMNARALSGTSYQEVARAFLTEQSLISATAKVPPVNSGLFSKLLQHLYLTFTALIIALLIALPASIWLYWNPKFTNVVLYLTGLLQTIPSIALLAIMIPFFGIGSLPAIIALFLYALLPILRNTVTGLRNVDPLHKEAAAGLGMTRSQALKFVEWPLAMPSILTGIRIAAVINVGTATLAAFIGAGGLGEFIVTGLALNNTQMILMGALPAAALALVIELIFEAITRRYTPANLKSK